MGDRVVFYDIKSGCELTRVMTSVVPPVDSEIYINHRDYTVRSIRYVVNSDDGIGLMEVNVYVRG